MLNRYIKDSRRSAGRLKGKQIQILISSNEPNTFRNGCATSEDLFWKLDALQSFIRDLHWPDLEFRQHLEQRLKLMACDMIESCIQRTENAFQQWLKKTVTFISTDYIIPSEMCAMVNVILDAKNQSFKLCAVDGIDVVSQFDKVLRGVLLASSVSAPISY